MTWANPDKLGRDDPGLSKSGLSKSGLYKPGRYKLAMIGGGAGAFIGGVHRMAAALDGRFTFCAGALSSDPNRAVESGIGLGLDASRSYPSWQAMLDAESRRPIGMGPDDRIDAAAIVTPNATHFAIAKACVEQGLAVMLDKPMVTTVEDAAELVGLVHARLGARDGLAAPVAVSYNYTGYPMVRHMRSLVGSGAIGAVLKVCVEYHQGWLARALESTGHKQAAWRLDPALAGEGGAIGDIGTHCESLVAFVTGRPIVEVNAELHSFVPGRQLDDDASVLVRLGLPGDGFEQAGAGPASGTLSVSQICHGEHNGLTLRVFGRDGSLGWNQEHPDQLHVATADGSTHTLHRGALSAASSINAPAIAATRLPPGHSEGFIEAFANLYRGLADALDTARLGAAPTELSTALPTVNDGARGVRFIRACVRSKGHWVMV